MQDIVYKLVPGLQEGKCQNLPLDLCVLSRASKGLFVQGSWLWTSRLALPWAPCRLRAGLVRLRSRVSLCSGDPGARHVCSPGQAPGAEQGGPPAHAAWRWSQEPCVGQV